MISPAAHEVMRDEHDYSAPRRVNPRWTLRRLIPIVAAGLLPVLAIAGKPTREMLIGVIALQLFCMIAVVDAWLFKGPSK